jgi:hypothetical protein
MCKSTEKRLAVQGAHFFACFGMGWATAATREEAIDKLINSFRSEFKAMAANQIKANEPGAYIWTCQVNAPEKTPYRIEFFQPKGVETEAHREVFVTRVTAKVANYWIKD